MPPTTLSDIQIPQDVERFCTSHGILTDLHLAIRSAEEVFPPIRQWQLTLDIDPETDEEAVVIDIRVPMAIEDAVKSDWAFANKWTASASIPARGKIILVSNPT